MRVEDRLEASAAGKPTDTTKRPRGPVSVPSGLDRPARDRYEFVILGAGCSGLSLCYYLLERGVDAPILILDRKRTFEDDRTWCFWEAGRNPFEPVVCRQWATAHFYGKDFHASLDLSPYRYKMIRGIDFYRFVKEALIDNPSIQWAYENIVSITDTGDGAVVTTSRAATRRTGYSTVPTNPS